MGKEITNIVDVFGEKVVTNTELMHHLELNQPRMARFCAKMGLTPDLDVGSYRYWKVERIEEIKAALKEYKRIAVAGRPKGSLGAKKRNQYQQMSLISEVN